MEERVEGMTDNQWDGMIKMFMVIVDEVREPDRILQKLTLLLKDKQDAEKIISSPKKQKPED